MIKRISIIIGAFLAVALATILLSLTGGRNTESGSAAYRSGYAFGSAAQSTATPEAAAWSAGTDGFERGNTCISLQMYGPAWVQWMGLGAIPARELPPAPNPAWISGIYGASHLPPVNDPAARDWINGCSAS
jgi:hypothetical protein